MGKIEYEIPKRKEAMEEYKKYVKPIWKRKFLEQDLICMRKNNTPNYRWASALKRGVSRYEFEIKEAEKELNELYASMIPETLRSNKKKMT